MEREGTPILVIFRVLVLIAWIGLALASLYLAIGVPLGSLNARLVNPWLGVSSWDSGLVIGVSRESLTPEQWRTFCSSVGIWSLGGTLSALVAVEQVRRIVSEPSRQSPFTAKNARRVRNAGLAVFVSAFAKAGRDFAFARFISNNVRITGAQVGYVSDLGVSTIFLGIMILAVAEVMRHGVKLQEDQDLTV
ncbi:MAG: DUF2975 domain-containing protein [Bacillota bacterium]